MQISLILFHLCNKVNNETVCDSSSIQLYHIPEIKKNQHIKLGQYFLLAVQQYILHIILPLYPTQP